MPPHFFWGIKMRRAIIFFLLIFSVFFLTSKDFYLYVNFPLGIEKQKGIIEVKLNGSEVKVKPEFFKVKPFNKSEISSNYILDVRIFDYYSAIRKGVESIIDVAYDNMGVLILITPKKVYTFSPFLKKEELKKSVLERIKEDTISYRAEMGALQKDLKKVIEKFLSLEGGVGGTSLRTLCMNFITDFLNEWGKYRARFLEFDRGQVSTALSFIDNFSGKTYYIGIYHREIIPYYDLIQKSIDSLQNFISSAVSGEDQAVSPMISAGINRINKALMISDERIINKYSDLFLLRNISYSVVFTNNKMNAENKDGFMKSSPDFEGMVDELSKRSGGIRIITDDIEKGLRKLAGKASSFAVLKLDLGEKDYKVFIKTNAKEYFYPKFISKGFLKKVFRLKKKGVKIENFDFDSGFVSFKIKNFAFKKRGRNRFGFLDVRIVVKDKNGAVVYRTRNMLQVFKPPHLRIPVKNYEKAYLIEIYVGDLLKKSSSIFKFYI